MMKPSNSFNSTTTTSRADEPSNHRNDNNSNNSNNSNNKIHHHKPCILWSCVARNEVILAEANLPDLPWEDHVKEAAQLLFRKKETPGWEYVSLNRRTLRHTEDRPKLKGMKFHMFEHNSDGYFIWSVSAVYDPATVEVVQVQSFIEKMVTITEVFRETDPAWKYGSTLSAQTTFAPILLQRMAEVSYLGKLAMVNEQVENLKSIMERNIELVLERGEKMDALQEDATRLQQAASVFKKRTKKVRREMMWKHAKHGMVLGTAITAGVAVVVVPSLIAIL